jgi:hypothetical protein
MIEPKSNKKDFFISYNHHDEDAVRWIPGQMMWAAPVEAAQLLTTLLLHQVKEFIDQSIAPQNNGYN